MKKYTCFKRVSGINRNILECKVTRRSGTLITGICINRNILECKVGISASHLRRRNVLIETYWNVNSFPAARNMASVGINRNILECKFE